MPWPMQHGRREYGPFPIKAPAFDWSALLRYGGPHLEPAKPHASAPEVTIAPPKKPVIAPANKSTGGATGAACFTATAQAIVSINYETCIDEDTHHEIGSWIELGVGIGAGISGTFSQETTWGPNEVQGYASGTFTPLAGPAVNISAGGGAHGAWVAGGGGIGLGETDSAGIDIPVGDLDGNEPARRAIDYAR